MYGQLDDLIDEPMRCWRSLLILEIFITSGMSDIGTLWCAHSGHKRICFIFIISLKVDCSLLFQVMEMFYFWCSDWLTYVHHPGTMHILFLWVQFFFFWSAAHFNKQSGSHFTTLTSAVWKNSQWSILRISYKHTPVMTSMVMPQGDVKVIRDIYETLKMFKDISHSQEPYFDTLKVCRCLRHLRHS